MKRILLIGLALGTMTGCGQGWMPLRPFRGAPCGSDICSAAPNPAYVDPGCNGCGTASGYPGYDGAVMGSEIYSDGGYYGGEIIQQGAVGSTRGLPPGGSNTLPPPMGSLRN